MSGHIELESKIIEVDYNITTKELKSLGAELDFQRKKFTAVWMENKTTLDKVRIREEGENTVMERKNLKEGIDGIKIAGESEPVKYESLDLALSEFSSQGYKEISRSVKARTSYILTLSEYPDTPVKLVIDEYSDLDGMEIPALLEIEVEAESESPEVIEAAKKIIIKVANLLGYIEDDLKKWTAKELVEYYKQKK